METEKLHQQMDLNRSRIKSLPFKELAGKIDAIQSSPPSATSNIVTNAINKLKSAFGKSDNINKHTPSATKLSSTSSTGSDIPSSGLTNMDIDNLTASINDIISRRLKEESNSIKLSELKKNLADIRSRLYHQPIDNGDVSDEAVRVGLIKDTKEDRARFKLEYQKNIAGWNQELDRRSFAISQQKFKDTLKKYDKPLEDANDKIDKELNSIRSGQFMNSLSVIPIIE